MVEKDTNSYLVHSLKEMNLHAHKIPDSGAPGANTRFKSSSPYDMFLVGTTHFIAIEGKLIKPKGPSNYMAFNFSHFRDHQLPELLQVNNSPIGVGIIAIYVWKSRAINMVHFINVQDIIAAINQGKKSLNMSEVEEIELKYSCKKSRYILPTDIEEKLVRTKHASN